MSELQRQRYNAFYNTHLGICEDVDGVWGCQCVDAAKSWMRYNGFSGAMQALGGDGFAHQYFYRCNELGLLSFFDQVFDHFEPGDMMVYMEYPVYTPLSHVGLYHANLGNGWHQCFSQNQGGENGCYNVVSLPDEAILCGYRLKEAMPEWSADGQCVPGSHVKCSTDNILDIDFVNHTVLLQLMNAWIPIDLLGFGNVAVDAKKCKTTTFFTTIDGKMGVGPTNARMGTGGWQVTKSNLHAAGIDMKAHKLYFDDVCSWLPWEIVETQDFKIKGNCWMTECEVEDIDVASNKIKVHGLWVNPGPFLVKNS